MVFTCTFSSQFSAYSAEKEFIDEKLEAVMQQKGFIPDKTAIVTGNCYLFVSAVCEKLFGYQYDGEGLYGNYRSHHYSGNFYTVATYETKKTYPTKSVVEGIIKFFLDNAVPGDIIHYGAYTTGSSNNSTHTWMVSYIDNEKIGIYHANYQTVSNPATACHVDYIYWDSFRESPTQNEYTSGGKLYSMNSLFYNKMKSTGLGITINRAKNYEDRYYFIQAAVPKISVRRHSSHSIKLTWTRVKSATKYEVQYRKTGDKNYKTLTDSCKKRNYVVKNLEVGTQYQFRVRAFIGDKWFDYSPTKKLTPKPPKVAKVSFDETSSGIKVSWSKSKDITGLKLYKSTKKDSGYSLIKDTGNNTTLSFVDKDVEYGKKYYYKLVRYIVENNKTYKSSPKVKSSEYELEEPFVSTIHTSASSVRFTLKPNGACDKYRYYFTDEDDKKLVSKTYTTDASVDFDSLEACGVYKFYVAQKTKVGIGEYKCVKVRAVPAKVEGVKADAVPTGIKVSFNQFDDADGYYVLRSTKKKNGTYSVVAELGSGENSYTDTKVKFKKTYYYKVAAYSEKGDKKYWASASDYSSAKNTVGKCEKVRVIARTPASATVKWKKADNASRYVVEYKMKKKGEKWTKLGETTANQKVVRGLELGTLYCYRVKAYNSLGSGAYSDKVTKKAIVPKPEVTKVKLVSNGIRVYWNNRKFATGYRIYRATSKNGKYKLIKDVKNNTSSRFTDKNITYGKRYYYKVQCYRTRKKETYFSSKTKPYSKSYVLITPILRAQKSGSSANLEWDKIEGAGKYRVQYKVKGGAYKTLEADKNEVLIANMRKGHIYYFRVKAVSDLGSSTYCTAKKLQF